MVAIGGVIATGHDRHLRGGLIRRQLRNCHRTGVGGCDDLAPDEQDQGHQHQGTAAGKQAGVSAAHGVGKLTLGITVSAFIFSKPGVLC